MNLVYILVLVFLTLSSCLNSIRWGRVAQREHYIAGYVTKFYFRWVRLVPFNNLYFKYNKERLPLAGSVYLQESDDLTFIVSLCHHFKMRSPLIIRGSNSQQSKMLEIFLQTLSENQMKSDFINIIQ